MSGILTRLLDTVRTSWIQPLAQALPWWVTPNLLTGLRFCLVLPLVVFLLRESWWAALAVYLVAVFTDALDGELARVRQVTSVLGARLDPSVDKVLHIVAYAAFLDRARALLLTLIALDALLFLVGVAVVLTQHQNIRIAGANVYGKWKLLIQVLAVLLLFSTVLAPGARFLAFFLYPVLLLAVCFAVFSMLGYLRHLFPRLAETR